MIGSVCALFPSTSDWELHKGGLARFPERRQSEECTGCEFSNGWLKFAILHEPWLPIETVSR